MCLKAEDVYSENRECSAVGVSDERKEPGDEVVTERYYSGCLVSIYNDLQNIKNTVYKKV